MLRTDAFMAANVHSVVFAAVFQSVGGEFSDSSDFRCGLMMVGAVATGDWRPPFYGRLSDLPYQWYILLVQSTENFI